MKLDLNRMIKVFKENDKKVSSSMKKKRTNFIIDEVNKMCQKDFDTPIGMVHYVNCANPHMKLVDDNNLIKISMLYGMIPNHNDDFLGMLFDEIENRGHTFVDVPKIYQNESVLVK